MRQRATRRVAAAGELCGRKVVSKTLLVAVIWTFAFGAFVLPESLPKDRRA